ncbi:hypothetical protein RN001_014202 [Aquatica leii]|uniref:methylated diphthine methylhydrolase n=1 Tax=Aquatica leii TaxID=1421715 RepID=A0AAN7P1S4_9COLE|nr:hypothetical protein RN001_014202 [Aquatica leii]
MKTIYQYNTEFNADSVEWCPHTPYKNLFVCANYQLNPETQKRTGKILLFTISPQTNLKLCQTLNTSAVLDQKWCHHQINGESILGVVNADHCLEIYKLDDYTLKLVTSYELDNSNEVLILSLDWSTGKYHNEFEIVCSDSKGRCHIFTFDGKVLQLQATYHGHSYEAWIAAFYYWDTNIFFTGGDDSLFLKFDKRCKVEPVLKNKKHGAGVTSIHSNAEKEFVVATGSYDECIRLWDLRAMKEPCVDVKMPGPVWRLKWDPRTHKYLLACCMLAGAHVLDFANDRLEIVGSYCEHQSMTYGGDWSFMDADRSVRDYQANRIVATCSFYDSLLCVSKLNL